MKTIVLTGGGSGGHITPILAVATELKQLDPTIRTVYVGQKGDPLAAVPKTHEAIDECRLISAGKFRRYHGEGLKQLLDVPTVAKNTRDLFRLIGGAGQAYRLLGSLRPIAVYTPGGYVGVPVGVAAARRGIPLLTHDLDALPGLANRINARWASLHITALPPELYPYPPDKIVYAGVPVARTFQKVTSKIQHQAKLALGIPADAPVLLVIGGGQGAQRINDAVQAVVPELLAVLPGLRVLLVAGAKNEQSVAAAYDKLLDAKTRKQVIVMGFVQDVYRYSAAADLIITRAGATNMAEFSNQHKACLVIPAAFLTGGHQVKNVKHLQEAGAIELVTEDELTAQPQLLAGHVQALLQDPERLAALRKRLGAQAHPDAASIVAQTIIKAAASKKMKDRAS